MHQRESIDATALVFEQQLAPFGVAELVVVYLKFDVTSSHLHQVCHGFGNSCRCEYIHRVLASAKVHAADESGQPKEMVTMQMSDADGLHGLQLLVVDAHLGLGVLTTVQKNAEAIQIDNLATAMAGYRG